MNYDLMLMRLFLNESKFSVQVHLHSYHDMNTQLNVWSEATGIPRSQFIKPYLKKNSSLYKKRAIKSVRMFVAMM